MAASGSNTDDNLSGFREVGRQGKGQHSTVYKYERNGDGDGPSSSLPETVAVKVYKKDTSNCSSTTTKKKDSEYSFRRDLLLLKHVNVVATLLVLGNAIPPKIVLEYCPKTLEIIVDKTFRTLDMTEIIFITQEIAKGLCYLHENGIVHNCLMPSSVLLQLKSGTWESFDTFHLNIKLGGFHTLTKFTAKAVSYAAPEVLSGVCRGSIASDVYSLGVITFEMLLQRLPFTEKEVPNGWRTEETLRKALRPARCPVPLAEFLFGSLSRDRDARVPAFDAFRCINLSCIPSMRRPPSSSQLDTATLMSPPPLVKDFELFPIEDFYKDTLLGTGMSAKVYRYVRKGSVKDKVAVKVWNDQGEHDNPNPKIVQRNFIREKSTLKKCKDHSHIVTVFGFNMYQDTDRPLIVMELCQQSLSNLLGMRVFSSDETIYILRHIILATIFMHKEGILHRDLKPANILIQLRSAAAVASVPQWKTVPIHNLIFKVGDFGLSRFIPDDLTSMTDVGTPRYWAPEVHTKHYDKAVDIYSIGVIAFRLICGRVPAQHEAPVRVEASKPEALLKALEEKRCSDVLKRVLPMTLREDPKRRPSAARLLEYLDGKQTDAGQI